MAADTVTALSKDAEEFGIYARSGGWRLGLLVARNVERKPAGRPAGNRRDHANSEKVSARAFAEKSGTSHDRVLRYLDAWDRAAEAGHVPPAADLRPGIEFDLPEQETTRWADFYDAGRSSNEASVKRSLPALGRAAEADPEFAAKAAQQAATGMTPEAKAELAATLLADTAVGDALADPEPTPSPATSVDRPSRPIDNLTHKIEALARMASARRQLVKALTELQALDNDERSKVQRLVEAEVDRLETVTGWMSALMADGSTSWDDALVDLLAKGDD